MNFAKRTANAALAPGLLALFAATGVAHAGLPDPVVNGGVEISAAAYAAILTAPGTKLLDPPIFVPGGDGVPTAACDAQGFCNFGTGIVSATLGGVPQVLLGATPANGGGGDSSLHMAYDVEYQNPGAAPGATIQATVHPSDIITQTGLSAAQAVMTVNGVNGQVYVGYNCSAAAGAAFGCATTLPNAPFASAPVTLVENTAYVVDFDLLIYAHDPVQAQIDAYFTAPAGAGGGFIFSPGITGGGVPEPATWSIMLLGFGGLGAAMRSKRGAKARFSAA